MSIDERKSNIELLRRLIEEEDINYWLKAQMDVLNSMTGKRKRKPKNQ
jgi:hypothetical protein